MLPSTAMTSPGVSDLAPLAIAGAMLLAAVVAAAGTAVAATSGPMDAPKDRGLHRRPTATGGGVAILLGVSVGVIPLALGHGLTSGAPLAAALALAALMGLLGAVDDIRDLGPRLKLAAQAGLALLYAALFARVEFLSTPFGPLGLGPVIGVLGSALWIVVVTNAVNFMDGANGLSPGTMIIALAGLGISAAFGGDPGVATLALLGAAAGAGFLPWNLPLGRVFQGDAGALFSSSLFAALVLLAAGRSGEGAISLWFGPLALLVLLTDVFMTLLARARRGAPLLSAHRDHLFQRWLIVGGRTHAGLSVRIWLLTGGLTLVAGGLAFAPFAWRSVIFGLCLGTAVGIWRSLDLRTRNPGVTPNG
jgi:Fuc2NAc and GlcNAc transferase